MTQSLCAALVLVATTACGGQATPREYAPLPPDPRLPTTTATATPVAAVADPACLPDGDYTVALDLSKAVIKQANTGMDDTAWCKSMLEVVPAQQMATMTIGRDARGLTVEWPSGHQAKIEVRGPCEFAITSPPMPAVIKFVDGQGAGTSTYTLGTSNHPDESCTAVDALVTVTPLAAP